MKSLLQTKLDEMTKHVALYQKRIDRGVKYLDKTLGRREWLKRIKLNLLDLEDPYTCMCGQAFADAWKETIEDAEESGFSYVEQRISHKQLHDYGFLEGNGRIGSCDDDYDLLTEMWKDTIKKLKKQ